MSNTSSVVILSGQNRLMTEMEVWQYVQPQLCNYMVSKKKLL